MANPSTATPNIFESFASPMSQLIGTVVTWLLTIFAAALVIGMIVGFFTYGKPKKRYRSNAETNGEAAFEVVFFLGIWLMHFIMDLAKAKPRKFEEERTEWLDDRQLLAMVRGYTPSEFEEFVAEMFCAMGYKTALVGGRSDGGIDITMIKDGRRSVVQCKKFISQKVRPHDVRDFYGAMGGQHIDGKGYFVTTNVFTIEAEQFAEDKPIELVDGTRLLELIHESGVLANVAIAKGKTDEAAPKKCPKCGSMLVVKTNRKDGSKFWACPKWPDCRYTKSV